jgi:KDO2-lipid IV(A) lauroyltransferase
MYYLLFAVLYPLSILPLPVLYLLSDFAFLILYYVIGYRKEIVRNNLARAFPEKSAKEINDIHRRFYHSFCDQWMETVKLLSISKKELDRRITGNWEVFEALDRDGKNAYALLGHTYNWEWATVACQYHAPQQFAGIYLPVSNKAFDRLMLRIRSRSGAMLISIKSMKGGLKTLQATRHIVGMIADQNPSDPDVAAWLPFLHREAPFFRGPEAMARRAKGAVLFAGIKKVKRGYYKVTLEKKWDDASVTAPGEITKAYVGFMEVQLRAQPENWLWSHRRWKHVQKV